MRREIVKNRIKEENLLIFTPQDLHRFLEVSKGNAQRIAERYTNEGIFKRLKRGYYALTENLPSAYFIANYIYQPSYVSFESALSHYQMIPESIYSVTSATPKTTKSFEVLKRSFEYTKIKKSAYTGYRKKSINNQRILIAEPEKALADYFYLCSLGKKEASDRLDLKDIDREKLFDHLELFERKNLKGFVKDYL